MIKLTPLRNKVPLAIALATTALLATGTVSTAAVDTKITSNAAQEAQAAQMEDVGAVAVKYATLLGSNEIKLSAGNVKALASVLADAIIAKTPTANPSDPIASAKDPNRLQNKGDEIGEAVGIIGAKIVVNPGFASKATSISLKLLQGAVATAKKNAAVLGNSSPNLFQDVAGTLMLTFMNSSTSTKLDKKIYTYLKLNAALVGGNKAAKSVKTGLAEAFKNLNNPTVRYEDGVTLGQVIDPETDTRNG